MGVGGGGGCKKYGWLYSDFVGNKAKGESQNGCFKKTKHAKFSNFCNFFPSFSHFLDSKGQMEVE